MRDLARERKTGATAKIAQRERERMKREQRKESRRVHQHEASAKASPDAAVLAAAGSSCLNYTLIILCGEYSVRAGYD